MREPKIIQKDGKNIMYIDFSDIRNKDEIYALIERAKRTIACQLPKSLFTLTNISGMYFNTEIFNVFTDYAKANSPYVKSGAVVGMNGLMQIFYNGFSKLSGREIRAFKTEEEAIRYLISAN
jgi:hypothetical protein